MNDFISGAIGGVTGIIVSHPLDTLRIRRQIKLPLTLNGLYNGITPPLIGMGLEKCIVFGVYGYGIHRGYSEFSSGMMAGVACTTIVTPVERIKINMQSGAKLSNINILNIYKGYLPTLSREVPGFGIYFWTYNKMDKKITVPDNLKPLKTMIIGGLSGAFSWLFIYPQDVVKTRLQSEDLGYKTVRECVRDTYKKYGIGFFYKGVHLALVRAFGLHAGVWLGYDYSKKFLEKFN